MERQRRHSTQPHADRDADWLTLWPRHSDLGFGFVDASGVSFAGREVVVHPRESIRLPPGIAAEIIRRSDGRLTTDCRRTAPLHPYQIKAAMTCP